MQAVSAAQLPGLIDLTPGIRSLQIHYDGTTLTRTRLLGLLAEIEADRSRQLEDGDRTKPHRPSAAVAGTIRMPSLPCANIRNWCGPTRPGALPTSSSSAASTAFAMNKR